MEGPTFSDDLRRYLALVWHWSWLLISIAIIGGAGAFWASKKTTPIYQSVTKVLINEAPATRSTDYASILTSERLAQTYAQLLTAQPILTGVIEELGLNLSAEALKRAIDVEPVSDTQLIEIRAEDTDPQRAAAILNSLVNVFKIRNQDLQADRFSSSKNSLAQQLDDLDLRINQASESLNTLSNAPADQAERTRLETTLAQYRQIYSNLLLSFEQVRLAEAQSTSSLVQVEAAEPSTAPIRPRTLLNTILATIVGLGAGIGIVALAEALDDTLKSPHDVSRYLGLPVLGFITRHDSSVKLISAAQPRSPVVEAFRSLRTNLQFASVDYPVHTLLVTSPSPAEGKTTVASNLSVVLAQGGHRVALVDADLRRPNVHAITGISNRSGLSTLFVNPRQDVSETLQPTFTPNLSVLTAGEVPPNPSELLGSTKMQEILGKLKDRVDVVVIDTPPLMAVTDSAVLAPKVDGVLLVAKPGSTHMLAANQAVEQLRRVGANLLGVVLNEVDTSRSRYRYYRYEGYHYKYSHYFNEESQNNGSGKPGFRFLGRKNGTPKRATR